MVREGRGGVEGGKVHRVREPRREVKERAERATPTGRF